MKIEVLTRILELSMLVCFGVSWPFSILKMWKTKSSKGVSPIFLFFLMAGYIFGITMKILRGEFIYVGFFYTLNLIMISFAIFSYFYFKAYNKRKKQNGKEEDKQKE